jgi:type II secretory pathway pseudopilin PulG
MGAFFPSAGVPSDARSRGAHGFALIDLVFVIGTIAVLAMIAFPRLLLARQSASASSAIGSLRTINSSQLTFALTCGAGFYAPNLTTLGTPPASGGDAFISPNLAGANTITRGGYLIQLSATPFGGAPATCNGLGPGQTGQAFKAAADALEPTNARFFASNATGLIFEHTASLLAVMPEVGPSPQGLILK